MVTLSWIYSAYCLKNKISSGKAYLGGYRNKITGQKYHHAGSQTPVDQTKAQNKSRKMASDAEKLRSRQTQTTETRTLSVQVKRKYRL